MCNHCSSTSAIFHHRGMKRYLPHGEPPSDRLLLLASSSLLLPLAGIDSPKHHDSIAVHERNTGHALTVLESIAHEGLLWLEGALSHLIRLQRMWIFHFLTTSLLPHLPLELRDAASCSAGADKSNWRISNLDLVRDVEDLHLGIEFLSLSECGVFLVDHHVTGTRHVILVQALDVQTDIVTGVRKVDTLVVHLNSEHLSYARVRGRVRWQEHHLLPRLHDSLFHAPGQDISDTFDLVDARNWHAHWCVGGPLRHAAELVKNVIQRVDMNGLLPQHGVCTLPPVHV